jgi:hypothetical protein
VVLIKKGKEKLKKFLTELLIEILKTYEFI